MYGYKLKKIFYLSNDAFLLDRWNCGMFDNPSRTGFVI